MAVYRRTFAYFRPFLPRTLLALGLTTGATALSLLKPWPVKYLFDGVLAGGPARQVLEHWMPGFGPAGWITALCAILVGIHLLWGMANLAANYLFVHVGLHALLRIRTELYAYLQSLPLKYHDARRSSDSSFRVAYDSQAVQTIYNRGLSGIYSSALLLAGVLVVMLGIDWKLTLASLAVVPAVVLMIRVYSTRIRNQSTAIQEQESALLDVVQEGLRSVRMVHAFGREAHEVGVVQRQARQSLEANLRFNVTSVSSSLVAGTLMAIGTAAMYWIGTNHVLDGTRTVGDLVVFASYLGMLYAPLESLTYTAWALEGAAAGAQRCFEILDSRDDTADRDDARDLKSCAGRITVENVRFGYTPEAPVLDGVDLEIPPGQTTAIVGGTGAGKSTLLSLVPRFYLADAGRMLIDGHDVRELTKTSLRSHIGLVLQDTLLFSTTVRENIAYGRPEATDAEVVEAAKRAHAHEFIERLPDGYHSQVGERGGHLSVGQRQRIGIARAFLKNAPILLLDEPTSALDPETERGVMETIEELMAGRTTIIVTHRIHTVHRCDRVVVLENGRIAESGSGPELLAAGGIYARLFAAGSSERTKP